MRCKGGARRRERDRRREGWGEGRRGWIGRWLGRWLGRMGRWIGRWWGMAQSPSWPRAQAVSSGSRAPSASQRRTACRTAQHIGAVWTEVEQAARGGKAGGGRAMASAKRARHRPAPQTPSPTPSHDQDAASPCATHRRRVDRSRTRGARWEGGRGPSNGFGSAPRRLPAPPTPSPTPSYDSSSSIFMPDGKVTPRARTRPLEVPVRRPRGLVPAG